MVYSKRIAIFAVKKTKMTRKGLRYLLLKRQNDKKIVQVSASFPLSASHSLLSVKFLLNRFNYTKSIGKS